MSDLSFGGGVPQSFDVQTSATTFYTVPADTIAVVTSMLIVNSADTAVTFAAAAADEYVFQKVIEARGVVSFTSRIVMHQGEALVGIATADGIAVHINGIEVAAP